MATFISCPSQNQAVNLDSVDTITLIDTNNHQYCIEFYKKIMVQIPTQIASWSFTTRQERDAVYNKLKGRHFSEIVAEPVQERNRQNSENSNANGSYTNESN